MEEIAAALREIAKAINRQADISERLVPATIQSLEAGAALIRHQLDELARI